MRGLPRYRTATVFPFQTMTSKLGETNPHTAAIGRKATSTVAQMGRTTHEEGRALACNREGHEELSKAVSNKINAITVDYRSSNG